MPPLLFEPLAIRGTVLPNRIVVSPMAQYSALGGHVTDWHFAHYAKFALGGAGLIFTEAAKVERRGLGTVGDMGIWDDAHVPGLQRLNAFLHAYGAKTAIQLGHAGRKAGTYKPWDGFGPLDRSVPVEGEAHWEVIAPSAHQSLDGWPLPRPMSTTDIAEVTEAYVASTRRAVAAGFDIAEVHGAHGYLIHQFLSPEANRRTDGYGGSLTNRMRFALEVTEAVRAAWPADRPLFFRVSARDEAGWSIEDTVALAKELKRIGVDVLDCSSGGLGIRSPTASPTGLRPGYQVPFADQVRREAGVMTMAVGLIVQAAQAEQVLQDGSADLIAIGREMLRNPSWPAHAAEELGADPGFRKLPPQYGWWLDRRRQAGFARHAVMTG